MKEKQLIVIVGPTAVGKTALAIALAQQYKTEIISADSRQIFKELEIGTAKPTPDELQAVRHHFINNRSINQAYDAGQFGREALERIHQLFQHHHKVVLCGGSGLYVKAVTEGFDDMPDVPENVREDIIKNYHENGIAWLQQQVKVADPDYFAGVDQQNPQRLMRALELSYATRQPMALLQKQSKLQHPFQVVKIGLELAREELYNRIDLRMDAMVTQGLFDEAAKFYPQRHLNALQTVGYREIFDYMDGQYDKAEAIRLLKRNSRRYAKRQLTWFKKDKEITWFLPPSQNAILKFIEG